MPHEGWRRSLAQGVGGLHGVGMWLLLVLACRNPLHAPAGQVTLLRGETPAGLVEVGHPRELRGVWVASVNNINFPSRPGLSAIQQQDELLALLETVQQSHLNAIFFQVRPEGDALYASALEPASRFLTGVQGAEPGYDPLAFLIDHAHTRGIEVHAWLNPYRARANDESETVPGHMHQEWPEYAYDYGGGTWMDPSAVPVQDRLVMVVEDLVLRYDLDGVHFDDYFYPYPDGTPFPDDASYAEYQQAGGRLGLEDWRRDNVNTLIRRVSEAVHVLAPEVRFGISPFGIYRPGQPEGITGLDQYDAIFADPRRWTEEGWLDYLAPQLYWPSTQAAHAYEPLLAWWTEVAAAADQGQYTFAGTFLSSLGRSDAWTVDEFATQVELSRAYQGGGALGNIHFSIAPLVENRGGIRDAFAAELYPEPALPPPLRADGERPLPPQVTPTADGVRLSHPERVRHWAIYRGEAGGWVLDALVSAEEDSVRLGPGRWAISAVAPGDRESLGVAIHR